MVVRCSLVCSHLVWCRFFFTFFLFCTLLCLHSRFRILVSEVIFWIQVMKYSNSLVWHFVARICATEMPFWCDVNTQPKNKWFLFLIIRLHSFMYAWIQTATENTKQHQNREHTIPFIDMRILILSHTHTRTLTIHNGFAYAIPINVT